MKILIFLLIYSYSLLAQENTEIKKYAIEVAGIKVGQVTATRQQMSGDVVNYLIKSDVKINLLVYIVKINYEVKSQFNKNGLVFSEATANSNKGNFFTSTLLRNGQYKVNSKQEKKEFEKNINSPIAWSSSRMFFEQPDNNQKFYAEYYALFNQAKKNNDGTFTAELENNVDKYIYNNSVLVKVIKKNPIKNIELRLISDKVQIVAGN